MFQQLCSFINRKMYYQRLEDLKVLRHSPDLLNNVKVGQGQLQLIMKHILFYQPFSSSDLSNLMNNPSVISVIGMWQSK